MESTRFSTRAFGRNAGAVALALALVASTAVHSQSGAAAYTYDSLGRIASARYDPGFIVVYTYDANGNRLSRVIDFNSSELAWTSNTPPCTSDCWGGAAWNSMTWTSAVPPCASNCWGDALWKQ